MNRIRLWVVWLLTGCFCPIPIQYTITNFPSQYPQYNIYHMDRKKQYIAVGIIGVSFMLMFTAFNSLQNMISELYESLGLGPLGQIALFCIYGAFGLTTLVSSYLIEKMGYKKTMFLSGLGYAVFELTGLLVTSCKSADSHTGVCSVGFIYFLVLFGALICGFSAALIWIAQAGYVSDVADDQSKGELFGLFWALMMGSQIFGNIFTTFILGNISQFIYFAILSIIGISSSFLFLTLPSTEKQMKGNGKSLKQQYTQIKDLIFQKGSASIHLYYTFTGVTVACYAGFLYQLIKKSYPKSQEQTDDTYNKDLKFHEGLVFIVLGCSQVVTGLLMNRFSDKFNKYRMASFGTLIVEAAAIASLVTFFTQYYWMCFICSMFWGISETFLQSNTAALISMEYPGRLEAFSVFRIFFALGVTSTLLVNVILGAVSAPGYIFLVLVLVFQMATNMASETLENRPGYNKKESLLSNPAE